jgi:hypothetical protein
MAAAVAVWPSGPGQVACPSVIAVIDLPFKKNEQLAPLVFAI